MLISGTAKSILRLKMESLGRLFVPPVGSFFLLGPRGTGKSTWIRLACPGATVLDLLQPDLYREFAARPERLEGIATAASPDATIVLDEVQRVPELLTVVHRLIETPGSRRRFILTGSSARKLRRGGIDLLAGRALSRTMHPFLASELPRFELERALVEGMLPIVVNSPSPADVLRAYATLYLDEEVRQEGLTRNLGAFARFLEVVSFSHGAVINAANLARECQIERKNAVAYLQILEDLLLLFRVPVFARRARRATSVHPKLYLFDAGVYRSLRPAGPLDRSQEIDGAALEGLVAQHLRAWIAYGNAPAELFFWRTRAGTEVDFVVYGKNGFWALEVKNTDRVDRTDVRGLRAFLGEYPEATAALLYRGNRRERIDGVLCLPVEEFLRELRPGRDLLSGFETG